MTTPAPDRRVWLITDATSGFGRSLTKAALPRMRRQGGSQAGDPATAARAGLQDGLAAWEELGRATSLDE
jgi:hypothetical protein